MSATFILGILLGTVILVRRIRWLAVIVLLAAIGYVAHGRVNYWPHEERRDRTIMLGP